MQIGAMPSFQSGMELYTNILYVSHYSHYRMGGQKSMLALIENLDRKNFRPFLVCPEPGELSKKMEQLDCPVFYVPLRSLKVKNISTLVKNYFRIKRIIKENNIDIVHPDHERDAFLCGLAKKRTSAKMVWHVRLTRNNNLDKTNEKFADGIIGISDATAVRFSQNVINSGKFRVIYNGVDCSVFKPVENNEDLRKDMGIPADRFVIIFVGQITKGKGIFDLLNAMKKVKENYKQKMPAMLYYIGTPTLAEELVKLKNEITEAGLVDHIKIVPQQNKIYRWMQASDVLVLPSHEGTEGMGRVLFEAMACGAATIGTDISGIREAISEDSGFLVPDGSPDDMAEKLMQLIEDDDLLRKMKKNGRKRALQFFDIKKHAENVERFYFDIMKERL